jgi:hypothetical protein
VPSFRRGQQYPVVSGAAMVKVRSVSSLRRSPHQKHASIARSLLPLTVYIGKLPAAPASPRSANSYHAQLFAPLHDGYQQPSPG